MKIPKILKQSVAILAVVSLLVASIPFALAAEGDMEVDIVVRGDDTIGVENAEVYVYTWNTETEAYERYNESETYLSNSSGRVNNVEIPDNTTFYAEAYDEEGNYYANSGSGWSNVWTTSGDTGIINAETGIDRATSYVHLYPGEDTTLIEDETDTDGDGIPDDEDACPEEDATGHDEDGDGCIDEETTSEYDEFELEVTVYTTDGTPVEGAEIFVYVTDLGLYVNAATTDSDGRVYVDVPTEYEFYAIGYDSESEVYGGTYDYYFDYENYWTSDAAGETIENSSTGEVRITYLHLYPVDSVPTTYEGDAEEFDPETYECGGFPDAIYADLSAEECEAIEYVYGEGIFTGTDDGFLEWDREINRAEVTKVMVEAFDIELLEDLSGVDEFPDVGMEEWYTTYVYTARHNEIVDGYLDGYFRPEDTTNRVELLRIFVEASGVDYSDIPVDYTFYHDVEVTEETAWYMPYANYAFFNSLLENDGNLYPADPMTRLDVIKLLYRYSAL